MFAVAVAAIALFSFGDRASHAGDPDFTITTVVKQGDVVPGFGNANIPSDVHVNDSGMWLATITTTNPTSRIILTSAGVHMAEGDVLPGDIVISSLANAHKSLNNNGDIAHRPSLVDLNSGIVFDHDVLILHSDISTAPEFSSGTPYTGFFRARLNDNNRMLLVASVNDPGLPGTTNRALVWIEYDPVAGTFTESVLAKNHDQLPGQPIGVLVNDFGTGSERFAVNQNDDAMFTVSFNGGDAATNAAIYVNDIVVAQKGDAGPFTDATYNIGTSAATRVDINDHGDYVFLVPLTGAPIATNQAILRNNLFTDGPDEVVIRKGDPVPGVEGEFVLSSLGTGAAPAISNDGSVVWFGQWIGDSGTERGLFVDDRLIVRSGVTTSDGDLITNIAGTTNTSGGLSDGFAVSDNGKYIVARAVLNASTSERAVLLIEFDDVEPKCPVFADLTCDGVVNVFDLLALLGEWGECDDCPAQPCPADLDDNCTVNVFDLLELLANWG